MTDEDETPDPADAVTVAYIHDGDGVDYSFHHSTLQLLDYDLHNNARIWTGGWNPVRCGTDGLPFARNLAVKAFLDDSEAHWLWWIDTDMGFPPDVVDRLFEAADPVERPVMGALCFANREVDNDGMGGKRSLAAPVIMHWSKEIVDGDVRLGFDTRWDYPPDTVVRCDGIGMACVLIHRSVFEKVRETYGDEWYSRARNPSTGELISEDLSFCARMMALDIPVHVHTGVKTTHAKRIWLAEEDYWSQRALHAPPPKPVAPPDSPVEREGSVFRYAVIPTHNRPARLRGLIASLRAQADMVLVLDNASNPAVDGQTLAEVFGGHVSVLADPEQPPHLSRFWNELFGECQIDAASRGIDQWDVAVFNDDALVPPGWYDTVATAMREGKAAVAHTGDRPVREPDLVESYPYDRERRMAPHAFVVRGELGLRADESMRWWYFDDDFNRQAIDAGGVLKVPGPVIANSLANTTTRGPLAEQAEKDRATFEAKWSK